MGSLDSASRGSTSALFTPLTIANGKITLKHRIVMAPMTRNRGILLPQECKLSPKVWIADELVAKYYSQRATDGGLIVTESILPSPEAGGMPGVPGLWCEEQIQGWKVVTEAVHAKKGIIYAQITHQGRTSIPAINNGFTTVSSSATPWSTEEKYPYPPPGADWSGRVMYRDYPPIALSPEHLQKTIMDYKRAAQNAMKAGFDGVEIHAGNGYLLEQFLASGVNKRTDRYGGSVEGRRRFVIEVLEGVADVVGEGNVSLRLSPFGIYNDIFDEDRWETWGGLCQEVSEIFGSKMSYVSFVEARKDEKNGEKGWGIGWKGEADDIQGFRDILRVGGIPVISAGVWDEETAFGAIEGNKSDGVVFARWFVSNPDLVERLRNGWKFSEYNRGKFYGPTSKREVGYTDYKTWQELEAEGTGTKKQ
ncbi:hypothetical protein BGZ60DRAFT_554969 [Tricladium varicosporioides]|nr:hypothetical protein BGZ60DRAFT_554969 [Hymenoscyphus varicosporioides]